MTHLREGTTMKVCKQNGIDCIISEIDKEKENTILEKLGEKKKRKKILQAGTLLKRNGCTSVGNVLRFKCLLFCLADISSLR